MAKAALGGTMVILMHCLSQSKNYYLAGLIPLFPIFALFAHFMIGSTRPPVELKATILFGAFALFPYLIYLLSLYFLVDRLRLPAAITASLATWCISAGLLVIFWKRFV